MSPLRALAGIALCLASSGCSNGAGDASRTTGTRSTTTAVAGPTGASAPASGPTSAPESRGGSLRIVAVELQFEDPSPGGQGVWLLNSSRVAVDASCWELVSVATGEHAAVARGTEVGAGATLRLATPTGLLASTDTITLRDASGREVDRTSELTDATFDDRLWVRGAGAAWLFGRFSPPGPVVEGRMALGSTC